MANPPVAGMVLATADITLIGPATADWSAARDAVQPQLVSTYTHAPWTTTPPAGVTPPAWSPSWGLAWIGVEADGSSKLYFTALDENGQRLAAAQPPPYPKPALPAAGLNPPAPVGIVALGADVARIQDFRLAWNGRVFMLVWVEEKGGRLQHRCTLVNRLAGQAACERPSAALLRALLVNSATNLAAASLPDLATGCGWGRVNLRQCLAPAQPVTLQLRDDCAIGPGRSVRYLFTLPTGTALLRVTLTWTDPPGARIVNPLHLTVRLAGAEFRGNLWDPAAGRRHLSRAVATPPAAADAHENVQAYKQVVIANPASGDVDVEVSATAFPADPFNQQNLQPFALVFAGSGPEVVFNLPLPAVAGAATY